MKKIIKKFIPGIAWQHPAVNLALYFLDPIDFIIRYVIGLEYLPRLSVRVRSNGFKGQFSGRRFARLGQQILNLLVQHAGLAPNSDVLEIGCGCGRVAFPMAVFLEGGTYTGADIEEVSLESCRKNAFLASRHMHFDLLNVHNAEYNPQGTFKGDLFRFPYADGTFDVVFLISVFTHMQTNDVENYMTEIARLLKPGGRCLFSTYLVDHGALGKEVSFPKRSQNHFYRSSEMPEIAIGYLEEFFAQQCVKNGLSLGEPLWGLWRLGDLKSSHTKFGQDILIASKSLSNN